jgi:hypothetical protein
MRNSDEHARVVEEVAERTIELLEPPITPSAMEPRISRAALDRLAGLLRAELVLRDEDVTLLLLCARSVVETWLTGHATLLLGARATPLVRARADFLRRSTDPRVEAANPDSEGITLLTLARVLDAHVYGVAEPPKAYQRHLLSFFDEIDIAGAEGTVDALTNSARPSATGEFTSAPRRDVIRVSLWVVLFLAHDEFDSVGDRERAQRARDLFDQLRDATVGFYERRRSVR